MSMSSLRAASGAALLATLSACGSVPVQSGRQHAEALLQPATGKLTQAAANPAGAGQELKALLAAPLDAAGAVRIAWLRSPQVQLAYAQLGVTAAEVFEASRPANPRLGLEALWPEGAAPDRKLATSLEFNLQGLLALHARRQYSAVEMQAAEQRLAATLHGLALDVQDAWVQAVAAGQRTAVREAIDESARLGADLMGQYREAGNVSTLELAHQGATASEARISLLAARREAGHARAQLRTLLGLRIDDAAITLPTELPPTTPATGELAQLRTQALGARLDLAAARNETEALRQRLAVTRRYRLLGDAAIGPASERDGGGPARYGLGLGLELPLFSQGQGAVARAESQLQASDARLRQAEATLDAGLAEQLEALAIAEQQYSLYRGELIPQVESIVAQLSLQGNAMLSGPFELLEARQRAYAAWEGAADALRDYWQARIALARTLGAQLPMLAQEGTP